MLYEIINNLKKTLPDAFKRKEKPDIPWIYEKSEIKDLRDIDPLSRELNIPPKIFIDPESKIIDDQELEDEIGERGVEALAWYISFHQSNKWGIYFRVRGLSYLSNIFKYKSNSNDINRRIKVAYDLLFYHEFFHFLTDMVSSNMEMAYKKVLYNYYLEFLEYLKDCKWDAYNNIYIEEPLANAYVLKRMPKKYHYRIKIFFNIQPKPYSQFCNFLSEDTFIRGKRKLGAIVRCAAIFQEFINAPISENKEVIIKRRKRLIRQNIKNLPIIEEPFWEFLYNVDPEKLYLPYIPIYFVSEEHPNGKLRFKTPIIHNARICVYIGDHPPPHIHVYIPANNKKDGRYLYPSLKPYLDTDSLSNKKIKILKDIIKKHKNKIESILKKQKVLWGKQDYNFL